MSRVWLSPASELLSLDTHIARKAEALTKAADQGKRFLVLPTKEVAESAAWIWASFRAPITVVPVPADLPAEVLGARLAQLPPQSWCFPQELSEKGKPPLPPEKSREKIWSVIFTSGSSGKPKGVALSGKALAASAQAHAEHLGAGSMPWLLDLPLYHVGGLSVLSRAHFLNLPVGLGASRFQLASTQAWLQSGRISGLSLVPTTLFRLLESHETNFSHLKILLLGGAPANNSLLEQALVRGAPVHRTYGMTEHASQIATERVARGGLEALPGVELRFSQEGEILVRSSCLASGILQNGEIRPLALENGYFPTGDLGEWSGGRLLVNGRKSELIISGGKKIFPQGLEQKLSEIRELADVAITSISDSEWGEVVCALLVKKPGAGLSEQQARDFLAPKVERFEMPKHWVFIDSIPRAATGKILRPELRALAASLIPSRN